MLAAVPCWLLAASCEGSLCIVISNDDWKSFSGPLALHLLLVGDPDCLPPHLAPANCFHNCIFCRSIDINKGECEESLQSSRDIRAAAPGRRRQKRSCREEDLEAEEDAREG